MSISKELLDQRGELIGKGRFSKVYAHKRNQKRVIIVTVDLVKEVYTLGGLGRWFPELERVDYGLYTARRYERVRAPKAQLTPLDYKDYKALRKLHTEAASCTWARKYSTFAYATFELADQFLRKPLARAFKTALNHSFNYARDPWFEVTPRNIAVDRRGRLVLLDLFYDLDVVKTAPNPSTVEKDLLSC